MFSFLKDRFDKLKTSLAKTRDSFKQRLTNLFQKPWNEDTLEELEKILYESDIGSICTEEAIAYVKKHMKSSDQKIEDLQEILKDYALSVLEKMPQPQVHHQGKPHVILVIGINGSGKTTSIAKLARKFKKEGKKTLLAAADTFRAAASEQLEFWGSKMGVDVVKSQSGSDPSAVGFDALQAALARNMDIAIIDTAGRLQNKADLMQELVKIRKVLGKVIEQAPHETYLVLDATNGQNAIDQAKTFNECAPVSGIILTKIDGSAKGGVILPLARELKVPVVYLGTGESADDLIEFSKEEYVNALFKD